MQKTASRQLLPLRSYSHFFHPHSIGQQPIRECKEIYGKRIAKKLYFGSNVYFLARLRTEHTSKATNAKE
jgi:hypothetical protein